MLNADNIVLEAKLIDDMSDKAEKISNALRNTSDSGDHFIVTTEKIDKSSRGARLSFERLEKSLDPLIRVQDKYNNDLKRIRTAELSGTVSAEKLAKARELLKDRFEKESKAADRVSSEYDKLKRSLDPLAGATERLEREQSTLNSALKRGIISQDKYEDQLRKVRKGYDDYARSARNASGATSGFSKTVSVARSAASGAIAGIVASVGFSQISSASKDAASDLDSLAKKARALGGIETSEFLQSTLFALDKLGISTGSADKGLATLNKRVGELANGFGSLKRPLEKIAPEAIQPLIDASGVEERFQIILDVLNDIEDAGVKAAVAAAAFDTSLGKALGALAETDAKGFKDLQDQAIDLGLIIDSKLLVKSEELSDRFSIASQTISTEMKPALISAFEIVVKISEAWAKIISGDSGLKEFREISNEDIVDPSSSSDFDRLERQKEFTKRLIDTLNSEIEKNRKFIQDNPQGGLGPSSSARSIALGSSLSKILKFTEEVNEAEKRLESLQSKIDSFSTVNFSEPASPLSATDLSDFFKDAFSSPSTSDGNVSGTFGPGPAIKTAAETFSFDQIKSEIDRLDTLLDGSKSGDFGLELARDRLSIESEIAKVRDIAERASQSFDEDEAKRLIEVRKSKEAELEIAERILGAEKELLEAKKNFENSGFIGKEEKVSDKRLKIEQEISRLKRLASRSNVDFDEGRFRDAFDEKERISEQTDFQNKVGDSLNDTIDSFVRNLLNDGGNAFDQLAIDAQKSFESIFVQPFLDAIGVGLSGVIKNLANGEDFSFGDIFGGLEDSFSKTEKTIGNLVKSLGGSQGLSSFVSKAGTGIAAGVAGTGLGSSLGSFVRPDANQQNQNIGGTIGGGIGSLFGGPLGSFIGSTIGSFVGSLFGGEKSDKVGQLVFDGNTGKEIAKGLKDNSEESRNNLEISRGIRDRISTVFDQITKITGGAALNDKSTSFRDNLLNIASGSRDGIRIGFQGSSNTQRFDNDSEGASNAVRAGINLLIKSLDTNNKNEGSDRLIGIARALASIDTPAENLVDSLSKISAAIKSNSDELSEWQKRINNLDDTFDPLIEDLEKAGKRTGRLDSAKRKAFNNVRTDFGSRLNDDIDRFNDPLILQAKQIAEVQASIIKDAKALDFDSKKVFERNRLEWKSFIEQAAQTPDAIGAITEAIDRVLKKSKGLGVSKSEFDELKKESFGGAGDAFRENLQADILGRTNSPLAQLKQLLERQKDTLKSANDFAKIDPDKFSDLNAIAQKKNALEIQDFIRSLSDEDKLKLGDFTGLIEDYGSRISAVTFGLTSSLEKATNEFNDTLSGLERTLSDAAQAADTLRNAQQSILDQNFRGSGQEHLDDINSRIIRAEQRLEDGDLSAADDISSLAQRSSDLGFEQFGSSERAFDNQQFVLDVLNRTAKSQEDLESSTQTEIDVLKADFEINKQLLDSIRDTKDNTDFLKKILDEDRLSNSLTKDMVEEIISLRTLQESQNRSISNKAGSTTLSDATRSADSEDSVSSDDIVKAVGVLNETIGSDNLKLRNDLKNLIDEIKALRNDQERQNDELKGAIVTDEVNTMVDA